jgi:hypothetical protein
VLLATGLVACTARGNVGKGPYAAEVADAIPQIERATGLHFKAAPKVELRTRDQIRTFVLRGIQEDHARRDVAGEQAAYRLLGAIPDTLDLAKLVVSALTEQIAGYYDPRTKVLYIPTDAKPEEVRFVVSHELVHALQDGYINLDSLENVHGDNDAVTAARAVLEGQATLVGMVAMGFQLTTWEQRRAEIQDRLSAFPVLSSAPLIIQQTLLFPYLSGTDFMGRFYDRYPHGNPFTVQALPRSTKQIIHPAAYFGRRDAPTRVVLPAPRGVSAEYENDLGEFETRVLLFQHLRDQNLATRDAAGWEGDRYVVVRTPKGEGIAWLTVWDSPVDAAQFGDVLALLIAKRYPTARVRPSTGAAKLFATGARDLEVWGGDIAGQPAVLYVDVPAGTPLAVIDVARVKLDKTGG